MLELAWFRRVPCLRQSEAAECGVVCLAMVAGYFGRWIDLVEFRQSNRVSLRGTDLRTLIDLARDFGVGCRALRGEPCDLAALRLPAILHWNLKHFVVLTSVRRGHVVIHDPSRGRVRVPTREVSRCFSGVILECWPDTSWPAKNQTLQPRRRLSLTSVIASIRGHGWSLSGLITITLLLQTCVLVAPLQVQWVVDEALVRGDVDLLAILLLGFLLVLAVRAASEAVSSWLTIGISAHLTLQLGRGLFDHLVRLPLRWFENRHNGDIVSRFSSLQPLRETLARGLVALIVDSVLMLGSLTMLFLYDPLLSWIVVGTTLIVVGVRGALYPVQRTAVEQRIVAQAEEQTAFLEVVRGIASIRGQGLEAQRLSQWQRLNASWVNKDMKIARLNIGATAVETLAYGCQMLLVIYLGAHAVLDQRMSVGMLYAILTYRGHFSAHTAGLIDQVINLATLRVHLARLADILLSDPEPHGKLLTPLLEPKKLTLQQVSFRYADNEPWLFRHLNLSIAPGEFVALIGPSGSGKSSLLKVMCGQLDPVEGLVGVDDRSLASPDWRRGFRRACGIVMQNDTLFAGSIVHNVCVGSETDPARLYAVLARCGLAAVVGRLPMGIDSLIGDTAANLSAGQIQRLLLARALYREPCFLFIDEVTANLDVQTSQLVHELISKEQMTRVLVTHDIALAARADRVLVFDRGTVSELSDQQLAGMKLKPQLEFQQLDVEVV